MALVQHSFNMDVTAPPTPDQEHSFQTLKRSASTASLLSPPASVKRPSTKRLRAQLNHDSDTESILGDYLGRGKKASATRAKTRSTKRKTVALRGAAQERKDLNFIPVLNQSLVQPEPEVVQPEEAPRPSTPPPRFCIPVGSIVCPQTPPRTRHNGRRQTRVCRDAPLRDSPNNPFLVESCSPPALLRPRPKRSGTDFTEGPTVGYVFRGVPTVFANPYANQHPPSPTKDQDHPSFLPLEHPDFSPCELTRPQLLFPEAHGYARDGSPRPGLPPSTPKRGRPRAPRTPVRRSQRNQPVMMEPEHASGPKTPEPKTPQTRTRMRGASDAAIAGEVRAMKTRSKTAQAGKV